MVGPDDLFDGVYAAQLVDSLKAVPTMSIVMGNDALFDATHGIYSNPSMSGYRWERPTSLELIYPDDSPGFQVDAGIRILGAFSRSALSKKSLRLDFRGEYGPTMLRFPLFGEQATNEFLRRYASSRPRQNQCQQRVYAEWLSRRKSVDQDRVAQEGVKWYNDRMDWTPLTTRRYENAN